MYFICAAWTKPHLLSEAFAVCGHIVMSNMITDIVQSVTEKIWSLND